MKLVETYKQTPNGRTQPLVEWTPQGGSTENQIAIIPLSHLNHIKTPNIVSFPDVCQSCTHKRRQFIPLPASTHPLPPPLEVLASLIWKSEKPKCLVIGGHLGAYVSLPI